LGGCQSIDRRTWTFQHQCCQPTIRNDLFSKSAFQCLKILFFKYIKQNNFYHKNEGKYSLFYGLGLSFKFYNIFIIFKYNIYKFFLEAFIFSLLFTCLIWTMSAWFKVTLSHSAFEIRVSSPRTQVYGNWFDCVYSAIKAFQRLKTLARGIRLLWLKLCVNACVRMVRNKLNAKSWNIIKRVRICNYS